MYFLKSPDAGVVKCDGTTRLARPYDFCGSLGYTGYTWPGTLGLPVSMRKTGRWVGMVGWHHEMDGKSKTNTH